MIILKILVIAFVTLLCIGFIFGLFLTIIGVKVRMKMQRLLQEAQKNMADEDASERKHKRHKTQHEVELKACPQCGTFIALHARKCEVCGVTL